MGDNSMYWSDQSGWYQPQQHPQQAPPPYQSGSYPSGPTILNDHNHASTPPPTLSHSHQHQHQHHQHHHHQQQQQQQHHHHHHPHQQQPQPSMHQQMLPNGMSNGNHHTMQSTLPGPQQTPVPTQPIVGPSINHYNQPPPPPPSTQQPPQSAHLNNLHHEPMSSQTIIQQQQIDSPTNYQMHQQSYQTQLQPPPPPAPMYAQSNSYPGMISAQAAPSSLHSSMQQPSHQQPQHSYPQQQYSPPSYWNSAAIHNQTSYGPPSATQVSTQGVPTPPSAISDSTTNYHHTSGVPQQHQQPPPPPTSGLPPSNMPYESRGPNMTANYNATTNYQQSAPGYYSPHDVQAPAEPMLSYDNTMSHPQSNPPPTWSNGYYQPSQSPYPSVINPYQSPYNGSAPNQSSIPAPNQGPPPPPPQLQQQHAPPPPPSQLQHYPHHQAQQSHQWPPQNHAIPILERNKVGDKKPVKPRAPKKQSNPNAPTGRRKRPFMTEEHKQSGYAKFYQIKRKELSKNLEFGEVSKVISELWARLSAEERNLYVKDVSIKRKEMLKKKASQQAHDLLAQGTKQEQDLVPGMKQEPDLIQGLNKEIN